jgi:hypothetical protein
MEDYLEGKLDSIRNPQGIWINSSVFQEAGKEFIKKGYYCPDPWGSPAWFNFWTKERERIINGYSVGGVKITGDHYFYLNYCPIQKVENTSGHKSDKVKGFPDFWDGDYNYFWVREIARNGVVDSIYSEGGEESEKIFSLNSLEKTVALKRLFKGLHLEVKIETNFLNGGFNLIVGKSRRKGYQLPHSEVVMTPFGKKTMGDIKVGDIVSTPTGEANILEVYPQGLDDVYKVTLFDGREVRCGKEHLWKIFSQSFRKNYRQEKVVQTDFLLNEKLKTKKGYKWFLPINEKVINKNIKALPIPAYTLGCILGDGNVTKQLKISGADEQIFDNIISELGNKYYFKDSYLYNKQLKYNFTKEEIKDYKRKNLLSKFTSPFNPLFIKLKNLKLNYKSDFKYIPDVYKYHSSIEDRYKLVKGLMDTDGSINENGASTFGNVSKKLVEDLQEVLYSLGITSTLRKRKDDLFIIYINTNKNIFGIDRKINRVKNKECRKFIPIVKVEKLQQKEESSCFLLDSEDHLFLTNKYVVTHNSYKNASVGVRNYFTKPDSLTILNAYEKKFLYPKGIMTMAVSYINFINKHTGFIMPADVVSKTDHIRASYIQYQNGVRIEEGFMSEIIALTCKDNSDVNRGKDATDIIIEESGAFGTPGLLKALYSASEDCVKAGAIQTGQITIFGTSGDMEGGTADYADMYQRPEAFGLLPFNNIWDKDSYKQKVGFFHPIQWNMEGFYDSEGNSNQEDAKNLEYEARKNLIENGATSEEIQRRLQEKPTSPSEAFSAISTNNFPVVELKAQLHKVKANNWQTIKGVPVTFKHENGKLTAKPVLDGKKEPITSLHNIPINKKGCVVIYEQPVPDVPKGLYKIGYDPVRQDEGSSLAAIIVYKSKHIGTIHHSIIVAEYVGRMETPEEMDKIAETLADYYNTTIMHENEVTGVKNYFRRIKRLNLLAAQPDAVISKNIKKSKVARVYGCHMNTQLKDAGERYTKEWLLTILDYDENGSPIYVIDKIYSIRLLEELISYYRKGNFDLLSALFMCLFQVQEEELGIEYNEKKENKNVKLLLEMAKDMHKKA